MRCMTGKRAVPFALLAVAIGLAACDEPVAPGDPLAQQTLQPGQTPAYWHRMYGPYLEMAKEIPGYGGHYYDENKNIVVYLRDPGTQQQAAQRALMPEARQKLGRSTEVRSLKGKYSVIDLIGWHDAVRQNLYSKFGITSNGLDVRNQKITIGVKPTVDQEALFEALDDLGIPRDAVDIGEGGIILHPRLVDAGSVRPVQQGYTLQSRARTDDLFPGFVIQNDLQNGKVSECTYGVSIQARELGILMGTAGHCTEHFYRDNPQNFMYQRVVYSADRVGPEIWSPPRRTDNDGGPDPVDSYCPNLEECVWSDFSLFLPEAGGGSDILSRLPAEAGVKEVYPQDPDSPISTDPGYYVKITGIPPQRRLLQGDDVVMVGMVTGRSEGVVTNSCEDYVYTRRPDFPLDPLPERLVILCQTLADYNSQHGDSGAPLRGNESGTNHLFMGIHQGRDKQTGDSVFSPTADLISDPRYRAFLGDIRFCPTCAWH